MRIIYAEDDLALQQVVRIHLESAGHIVEVVNNGRELLDRLERSHDFDVIITDHNMPCMTGLEALRRIKEDDRFKHLPTIVLSGNNGNSLLAKDVKQLGGTFIDKYEWGMLFSTINSIAAEQKGGA
ncbi:MAG: response regulator [Minisyncoccia bacterium]